MQDSTNRISLRRLNFIIVLALELIGGAFVFCYFSGALVDKVICILSLCIVFFLIFVLSMTHDRLKGDLNEKIYVSYGKAAIGFLACWIANVAFLYVPEYFAPVMIVSIILSCLLNSALAISCGIFFVILLSITMGSGNYVLMCYCMMAVTGGMLGHFSYKADSMTRLFSAILAYSANVLYSLLFYYFAFLEIDSSHILNAIGYSLVVAFVMIAVVPLFSWTGSAKEKDIFSEIIDDDYPLVQDIRKFSYIEYQHARRVSSLSAICAGEIGANVELARSAGFYYRLGKMEGEPEIDNAIRVANDNCFPKALIDILSEYGGILRKPSTPESAIIHMVDAVVTKIELMDQGQDTMQSSWNQNMVIYQTINELSQKGLYDDSGLSMNRFLLVREKLAKEDILA